MTKNTEKVAGWFRETFLNYGWEVNMYRLYAKSDWAAMQPNCYFDDYDVVCLGSPIVAGGPLTIVTKLFSLGGCSGLKELKAKALIADFVEDYFLTNDGQRRPYGSEYITIS